MKIGNYALYLEHKVKDLIEEYRINYFKLFFDKRTLVGFESDIVNLVKNLLPNDRFSVLKAIENLETKHYEVHLEINGKSFIFYNSVDDRALDGELFRQIFLLPNFSIYDIELTVVSNDTFFLGEESFFVSANPKVLREAFGKGLPISYNHHNVWYKWIDNKKVDKSKMSYLKIELVGSASKLNLKKLMIDGINSFSRKRKLPYVSSMQLELVDLSRSQIKRNLPIVQKDVNYDAWKSAYINGTGTLNYLLSVNNEIFLGGRLADYIWAYAIVKEYKCNVMLIPFKENPNPSKTIESSKFLKWIEDLMDDFPELNDSFG